VKTLGARPRSLLGGGRRPKTAAAGNVDPEPVTLTRVTVIEAEGLDDERAAREWLERCRKDGRAREDAVLSAVRVANRAVHAHRLAAADPYAHEVSPGQAYAIRLGYGRGEEVVDGHWHDAYALPADGEPSGRRRMLAPQEQTAGILGGRSPAYPSEDLLLRARLDLEQERYVQAALQLSSAVAALESELSGAAERPADASAAIGRAASVTRALARRAGSSEPRDDDVERLREALAELERVARRRRHA
jgi:hypothetical protein